MHYYSTIYCGRPPLGSRLRPQQKTQEYRCLDHREPIVLVASFKRKRAPSDLVCMYRPPYHKPIDSKVSLYLNLGAGF